jgi:hypothetical protein
MRALSSRSYCRIEIAIIDRLNQIFDIRPNDCGNRPIDIGLQNDAVTYLGLDIVFARRIMSIFSSNSQNLVWIYIS